MVEVRGGDVVQMAMNRAGIYRICVERGKKPPTCYFGQSAQLTERWNQHLRALRAGRHDNIKMQRSFRKYGESAFSFSIVLVCSPTKEAMTLYEQAILDFYRQELGERRVLNVMRECVNTHLGVKRRPETIMRMSLSQKGRKKSPEQIAKCAAGLRGCRHSEKACAEQSRRTKGIPATPKRLVILERAREDPLRLENLRAALCGKPKIHSAETIAKISTSLTGKRQSDETKAKKSAAMKGRKHSPEHIANRVASRRANRAARMEIF